MTAATKYADHNREPGRTWLELRPMRALILFALACQLISCGGGREPGAGITYESIKPPVYAETVSLWTVKGDSTARAFGFRWTDWEIENNGVNAAKIDMFLQYPDTRVLKNVILMVGANNVGYADEDVDTVVEKYALLYWSLKADRVFCVGITPFQGNNECSPYKNPRIEEINEHIKGMCADYIDTWPPAMTPSYTDGIHHTDDYDLQIRMSIMALVNQ